MNLSQPEIFIIGGVSIDTLNINGEVHRAIGGAAMYTALAAQCAGAAATLFAAKPEPMEALLAPVDSRVQWNGLRIDPKDLPRLEIAHHGGGKATLLSAEWGAENRMQPDDLPADLSAYAAVHVAAMGTAARQLGFLRACRERGALQISAGTYAHVVYNETENVRALFEAADLFFMNANEAKMLFGSLEKARTTQGRLLFVTQGERGAWLIEADRRTHVAVVPVAEVDPTGAGDTFCGATLAHLALGDEPVSAARRAVVLAAKAVGQLGPGALL